MKKITIMLSFLLLSGISYSSVQISVNKTSKGLFGYSTVTEDFVQNGNDCFYSLMCAGSGWTGCRWNTVNPSTPPASCQNVSISGNGTGNTWAHALNNVMDYVEGQIDASNPTGTVSYPSVQVENLNGQMEAAVVVWDGGDSSDDDYSFILYSYSEAQNLGII